MPEVILITGAGSGFGALTAQALARGGHTVYASVRSPMGEDAARVDDLKRHAGEHRVDLRPLELDVTSPESVDRAVATVVRESGRLDVIVQNAGHMAFGPAEAFTPEQFAQLYDVNVLGTQRVCRAALPHLRAQRRGLLVWVSSTSTRGGTPPYLAPYFAAKAAMDSLAVSYAGELARWGVETSIVVPGAFPSGTEHFISAGRPDDHARLAEWQGEGSPYGTGFDQDLLKRLAATVPPEADAAEVTAAIVRVVEAPFGERPFRVHVDPAQDGAEVVNAVADRVRAEFLRRVGLADLLQPRVSTTN